MKLRKGPTIVDISINPEKRTQKEKTFCDCVPIKSPKTRLKSIHGIEVMAINKEGSTLP